MPSKILNTLRDTSYHDTVGAHLKRRGIDIPVTNKQFKYVDTISKSAAHDAGMGTLVGAGVGMTGGALGGKLLADKMKLKGTNKLLSMIAGGALGGAAGGGLGYLADKPGLNELGMSWSERNSGLLSGLGLGTLGAVGGGLTAKYFGDSDNPGYLAGGATIGTLIGLTGAYALANDYINSPEMDKLREKYKGDIPKTTEEAAKRREEVREEVKAIKDEHNKPLWHLRQRIGLDGTASRVGIDATGAAAGAIVGSTAAKGGHMGVQWLQRAVSKNPSVNPYRPTFKQKKIPLQNGGTRLLKPPKGAHRIGGILTILSAIGGAIMADRATNPWE